MCGQAKVCCLMERCVEDLVGQCARCLEEFPLSLDRPFSCVLMPLASLSSVSRLPSRSLGRELELNHEDLATSFYSGDSVDVSALVQEQFFLALPSRPLCQDECKGLCEQCGVNLNVETCTCRPVWRIRVLRCCPLYVCLLMKRPLIKHPLLRRPLRR